MSTQIISKGFMAPLHYINSEDHKKTIKIVLRYIAWKTHNDHWKESCGGRNKRIKHLSELFGYKTHKNFACRAVPTFWKCIRFCAHVTHISLFRKPDMSKFHVSHFEYTIVCICAIGMHKAQSARNISEAMCTYPSSENCMANLPWNVPKLLLPQQKKGS